MAANLYVNVMARDGVYGDALVLQTLSDLYAVRINVYSEGGKAADRTFAPTTVASVATFELVHWLPPAGEPGIEHYLSAVPVEFGEPGGQVQEQRRASSPSGASRRAASPEPSTTRRLAVGMRRSRRGRAAHPLWLVPLAVAPVRLLQPTDRQAAPDAITPQNNR